MFLSDLQHPIVYSVLLELADSGSMTAVRFNAAQLLNSLPTHSQVLESLRAALQGRQPARELSSLLHCGPADGVAGLAPARLLYHLQVLVLCAQPLQSYKLCSIMACVASKAYSCVRLTFKLRIASSCRCILAYWLDTPAAL